MKFSCRKVRDCIDGNIIYEYGLDRPISRDLIQALGGLGRLDYFEDFPQPFFRVQAKGWLELKGVLGQNSIEVIFPAQNTHKRKGMFEEELSQM